MKTIVHLAVFVLITASLLSVFALKNTYAYDLTNDQISRISANCLSIQGSLNQLHASDALLRVNRGQIYESMGSKLMGNFNARLRNNGLDSKGLVVVSDEYQTALSTFRNDYQTYERQLSTAIRTDCTKDQVGFHTALQDARVKRAIVHDDILHLNQYIDDYRSAVNDFMLNFQRVTGAN